MEKRIKRLLRVLQAEFALLWALNALLAALYESDILPQGAFAGDARMDYAMQTAGILLAVCLIPLALRMFHLALVRRVRQLPLPEALVSCRRWNEVRLAVLLVPALFNLTVYYTTLNTTGLLCVGMVMVASLFCVPSRRRLLSDLDLEQEDTELTGKR